MLIFTGGHSDSDNTASAVKVDDLMSHFDLQYQFQFPIDLHRVPHRQIGQVLARFSGAVLFLLIGGYYSNTA